MYSSTLGAYLRERVCVTIVDGIDAAAFVQQLQAKVSATEHAYNVKISSEQRELAHNKRRLDRNKKQLSGLREKWANIKERIKTGNASAAQYEEKKKQKTARLQDALMSQYLFL